MLSIKRYHNLDYLRGLTAFIIMYYHYTTWTFGVYSADSFLGKAGLYGVSVFYILSGLTLFLVYHENKLSFVTFCKDLFTKRAFRIFPLLWLVILSTIALNSSKIDYYQLFLNVTGLFSIIDCNISIARGGWSIGNEIVFYLFFPLFLVTSTYFKGLFYVLSFFLFACFIWFSFRYIDAGSTIVIEWHKYLNPLNQVFLFLAGYLIGYLFENTKLSAWEGLLFSLLSAVICFSLFCTTIELPKAFHKLLTILGETSYSVYLLHPVVWTVFERLTLKFAIKMPSVLTVVLPVCSTLIMSYFVYNIFEKYFIKMGRKILNGRKQKVVY